MFARAVSFLLVLCTATSLAQQAPSENRYDIVAKVFTPFFSVLLAGGQSPNKAVSFHMTMKDVSGRLPKQFDGATLDAAAQFPDKLKLSAPVLGEQVTVCRNGDDVWAAPGEKIEYLLKQFARSLPKPTKKNNTPLFIPITAQQAIFLPAMFELENGKQFEDLDGEPTRVISGGLMPDLAAACKAKDFRATIWVAAGCVPRQVKVTRRDFNATVVIGDLKFQPKLPAATWQPPAGSADVYHTTPDVLEQLLFVVMNSVNLKQGDPMPAPPAPEP